MFVFKLLPLRLICYHFNFAKKVPVKYGIGKCRDITLNTDRWFSKIINQQLVQILSPSLEKFHTVVNVKNAKSVRNVQMSFIAFYLNNPKFFIYI